MREKLYGVHGKRTQTIHTIHFLGEQKRLSEKTSKRVQTYIPQQLHD